MSLRGRYNSHNISWVMSVSGEVRSAGWICTLSWKDKDFLLETGSTALTQIPQPDLYRETSSVKLSPTMYCDTYRWVGSIYIYTDDSELKKINNAGALADQ